MYFTLTPKLIEGSENISSKTVSRRNKFLIRQLNNTCGNTEKASVVQTSKSLKSFQEDHRKNILMKANIVAAKITPEELVNMGIPWEKVKSMAREKNLPTFFVAVPRLTIGHYLLDSFINTLLIIVFFIISFDSKVTGSLVNILQTILQKSKNK